MQPNFVLVQRYDLPTIMDIKDISSDCLAPQHKRLIANKISKHSERDSSRTNPEKIKWWKLQDYKVAIVNHITFPPITTDSTDATCTALHKPITIFSRIYLGTMRLSCHQTNKQMQQKVWKRRWFTELVCAEDQWKLAKVLSLQEEWQRKLS